MSDTTTKAGDTSSANNTTHAAAAASAGVAGAIVVIIVWALGLVKIDVPAEVSAAAMVVITPILHLIAAKLNLAGTSN